MRHLILMVALVLAAGAHAADDAATGPGSTLDVPFKTHNISLGVGGDRVSHVVRTEIEDGLYVAEATYEYRLDKTYGIVAKVHLGENASPLIRDLKLTSLQLSFKARAPISTRWSAYGRLGVNVYRTRFSGTELFLPPRPARTTRGVGPVPAAGLEFNAFNGFLFGVEMQYLPMKDLNVLSLVYSVGYSF